jgi:hypothetical protein
VNNCSQAYTIQIGQPRQIEAAFESSSPDCAEGSNGSASVQVTGGVPPYSYSWSNGAARDSIGQLAAGIYTLTITDSLQCTALASVALAGPAPLVVSVSTSPATGGNSNGAAIVDTIEGGVSPYTLQWSDGETGKSDLKLAGGSDTLTVTDNNGCSQTYVIIIPTVTGINAVEAPEFAIYPNPASSALMIDVYQGKLPCSITIKNVLGQTVLSKNTSATHNEFDISDFSAGLYLVEVIQGGKKAVKQIVISR